QEEMHRLRPCYVQVGSGLKPLRPTSGLIFLTLHPVEDLLRNDVFDVVAHNTNRDVRLISNIFYERETTFYGYIQADRLKFIHIAKYPAFNHAVCPKIFLYKYGLRKEAYIKFKDIFKKYPPHSYNHRLSIYLLGEYLCAFHKMYLKRYAYDHVQGFNIKDPASEHVLVYKDEYGFFSLTPVLPKNLSPKPSIVNEQTLFRSLNAEVTEQTHDLDKLLRLVVRGKQDEVKALLGKQKDLALYKGQITDLSGRVFNNITAFQYAVWALDWHMWEMIRKFLPTDAQRRQLEEFKKQEVVHGDYFDCKPYLQSLVIYAEKYFGWKDSEKTQYWCQIIGKQQCSLPMHVINEYCRTDIVHTKASGFKDPTLPRTYSVQHDKAEKDFFDCCVDGQLGVKFAISRGYHFKGAVLSECGVFIGKDKNAGTDYLDDFKIFSKFFAVRKKQRDDLYQELLLLNDDEDADADEMDNQDEDADDEIEMDDQDEDLSGEEDLYDDGQNDELTYSSEEDNKSEEELTEYLVPADGNCLYTSIFLGYLCPVANDEDEFRNRFQCLFGNVYYNRSGRVLKSFLLRLLSEWSVQNIRKLKPVVQRFKKIMGMDYALWGGQEEIERICQNLNVSISIQIKNPESQSIGKNYILDEEYGQGEIKIIILQTDPDLREAVNFDADPQTQIAQMESAEEARNCQHYRLMLWDFVDDKKSANKKRRVGFTMENLNNSSTKKSKKTTQEEKLDASLDKRSHQKAKLSKIGNVNASTESSVNIADHPSSLMPGPQLGRSIKRKIASSLSANQSPSPSGPHHS
nr:hypothetical protein [Gammaproteobacteria bacterium]